MVLWQESLAPGVDELQQLDFCDGAVASSSERGHTIFVTHSGSAVVVHRKRSAAIQAVISRDCYAGVAVLSTGPDSRGVAAASVHMPSSWSEDAAFQSAMGQLDNFFQQVQALGSPQARVLLGGEFNVVLGATSSGRSGLVEAWAAAHAFRPRTPLEWTLRWRHPISGGLSLRVVDAFLVPREWGQSSESEVLHRAHVLSDRRPIVMRTRAQIGCLLCFKPSRPRLTG